MNTIVKIHVDMLDGSLDIAINQVIGNIKLSAMDSVLQVICETLNSKEAQELFDYDIEEFEGFAELFLELTYEESYYTPEVKVIDYYVCGLI